MKLAEVITRDQPLGLSAISADQELAAEVQNCLIRFGLLDPPTDGDFGTISDWALSEFCSFKGIPIAAGLTSRLARELLSSSGKPLPINPGPDLAGRIVRAMMGLGYWISRHPKCFNIVYVEGMNLDGTQNNNKPNRFNDVRSLLSIDGAGTPILAGIWKGTTEPSKYWTEHPMDRHGAARIAFGQYKSWSVGWYHNHEALRQVKPITVFRDLNKDFSRKGDQSYAGNFGMHHHWGYNYPDNDLGHSSAGCLVGQKTTEHKKFMSLVKSDPRYDKGTRAYRFMAAILPYSALPA